MIRVGLIGLGFMGQTHFRCYQKLGADVAKVTAIADIDPRRAKGDLTGTWGNIPGAAANHISMDGITGTTDYRQVLSMPDVDAVDICVPTPAHTELYTAAIKSGKHVLCEKPLVRTLAEAQAIAQAAAGSSAVVMPAMCIRFWPAYAWLKAAVMEKRFGKVNAATFRRVASAPPGWYRDAAQSGGAILDLHVHDTDFVCYLFGKPKAVFSRGYSQLSGGIDHILTQFIYDGVPLVVAEGGWAMAEGFGFNMAFTVNFEHATVDLDFSRPPERQFLLSSGGKSQTIEVPPTDGWYEEIRHFIDCIANRRKPGIVTIDDAVLSLRVLDAERESLRSGKAVELS